MTVASIVAATLIAILLPYVGVRLGLRMLLFALISLGSLVLITMLSLTFMDALAYMVSPWISPVVAKPTIVLIIAGTIIALALKFSLSVEKVVSDLSEAGNKSLGGALALTIAILVIKIFLFPNGDR